MAKALEPAPLARAGALPCAGIFLQAWSPGLASFSRLTRPAKSGAEADVPPTEMTWPWSKTFRTPLRFHLQRACKDHERSGRNTVKLLERPPENLLQGLQHQVSPAHLPGTSLLGGTAAPLAQPQ
eukprot:37205-Amphidinium_carterae.1